MRPTIFVEPVVYFATMTSMIVSAVRTKKMTKYSFLLCAPDMLPLSDEVDEGEHQDPHQIDEVPEQSGDLDVVRARVRPVGELPRQRLEEDHGQVGDAGEHVQAVKAGGDEEGGPHLVDGE